MMLAIVLIMKDHSLRAISVDKAFVLIGLPRSFDRKKLDKLVNFTRSLSKGRNNWTIQINSCILTQCCMFLRITKYFTAYLKWKKQNIIDLFIKCIKFPQSDLKITFLEGGMKTYILTWNFLWCILWIWPSIKRIILRHFYYIIVWKAFVWKPIDWSR